MNEVKDRVEVKGSTSPQVITLGESKTKWVIDV